MVNEILTEEFMPNRGRGSFVPDVVKKRFNWGAFAFGLFWGVPNGTLMPLVILPLNLLLWLISFKAPIIAAILFLVINLGWPIFCGIKGNFWAWQNCDWKSVKEFHRIQKRWAVFGVVMMIISIIYIIVVFTIAAIAGVSALSSAKNKYDINPADYKALPKENAIRIIEMDLNSALVRQKIYKNYPPGVSNEALAGFFAAELEDSVQNGKMVKDVNGYEYVFKANGGDICDSDQTEKCRVMADINGFDTPPNKINEDRFIYIIGKSGIEKNPD